MSASDTNNNTLRGQGSATRPSVGLPVIGQDRRLSRHCWEIVKESHTLRGACEECYAFYVQRDCWTLWALREPGRKPCCQKRADCSTCPVLIERLKPEHGESIQIKPQLPNRMPLAYTPGRNKKICRHFEIVAASGNPVEPGDALVKALQSRSGTMRCRLRGVHLDYDYVSDLCVSQHPEDCVFMEDAQPRIQVAGAAAQKSPVETPASTEDNVQKDDQHPRMGGPTLADKYPPRSAAGQRSSPGPTTSPFTDPDH